MAALDCLEALDDLVEKHAKTPVMLETYRGPGEELLGNIRHHGFPAPNLKDPREKDVARLPLLEVWEKWYSNRPKHQRDRDGCELLRAFLWVDRGGSAWSDILTKVGEWRTTLQRMANGLTPITLKYPAVVGRLLPWLLRMHPAEESADFLVETLETMYALIPEKVRTCVVPRNPTGRNGSANGGMDRGPSGG